MRERGWVENTVVEAAEYNLQGARQSFNHPSMKRTQPVIGGLLILAQSLTSFSAWANGGSRISAKVLSALRHLDLLQRKETVGTNHFAGEWPSFMVNRGILKQVLPQPKDRIYDSNAFATASIHVLLREIQASIPGQVGVPEIEKMLKLAREDYRHFESGGSYNFWPLLLVASGDFEAPHGILARGPNHYSSSGGFRGAMNVPNDADDTAVVFYALQMDRRFAPLEVDPSGWSEKSAPIGRYVSPWRDVNRTPHPYNATHGGYLDTGAFMTWFAQEPKGVTGDNFMGTIRVPGIPFGKNDVDCVVNANILRALASDHELDTPGASDACQWIGEIARREEYDTCGVYYPNRYLLHFAASSAYLAGATCLMEPVSRMLGHLLRNQSPDGAWRNGPFHPFSEYNDTVQTTAFALNALLNLADTGDTVVRSKVSAATRYLLGHARHDEKGNLFWDAGVYFSGGLSCGTIFSGFPKPIRRPSWPELWH